MSSQRCSGQQKFELKNQITKRKTRRGKNARNEALREEQTTEQEKQQSATGIENSEEQVDHVHASASEVEFVGRKNELGKENEKYWAQRYRFFSKFDDGVVLDKGKKRKREHNITHTHTQREREREMYGLAISLVA